MYRNKYHLLKATNPTDNHAANALTYLRICKFYAAIRISIDHLDAYSFY